MNEKITLPREAVERKTFETWGMRNYYDVGHQGAKGEFLGKATAIAWEAWQARAALTIPVEPSTDGSKFASMLTVARQSPDYWRERLLLARAEIAELKTTIAAFNDGKRTALAALSGPFQARVSPWMQACFGPEISRDAVERNHRFLEEALELVQACGCTQSEAHQLVDYVFGRPVGDPEQEAGGVMVTLAALCLAQGLDMHKAGETELARIWTKVDVIRAKQAAKPKHSPLPGAAPSEPPQPTKVYSATNDTSSALFASRELAEQYATGAGVGAGIQVRELPVFGAAEPPQAPAVLTDERIFELVNKRFVTGENLHHSKGYRYRSFGVPENVREDDLVAFARAIERELSLPAGFALVPLRMTQAMRDVTDAEDWTWEDLLAAANGIAERQYGDIALPAGEREAPGKFVSTVRGALEWYAEEGQALAANFTAKRDQAVLASVTVLSLDAGKRARDALAAHPTVRLSASEPLDCALIVSAARELLRLDDLHFPSCAPHEWVAAMEELRGAIATRAAPPEGAQSHE